jgi:hypothetical protein
LRNAVDRARRAVRRHSKLVSVNLEANLVVAPISILNPELHLCPDSLGCLLRRSGLGEASLGGKRKERVGLG